MFMWLWLVRKLNYRKIQKFLGFWLEVEHLLDEEELKIEEEGDQGTCNIFRDSMMKKLLWMLL